MIFMEFMCTVLERVIRFLQKRSCPGPVKGLVVWLAVWSAVRSAVQKYTSLYALPKKFTLFDNRLIHIYSANSTKNYNWNKLDYPKHILLHIF